MRSRARSRPVRAPFSSSTLPGIEAQTLANAYLQSRTGSRSCRVVNKIDLPQADPDGASVEVGGVALLTIPHASYASREDGHERRQVLDAVIERVPAPAGEPDAAQPRSCSTRRTTSTRGVRRVRARDRRGLHATGRAAGDGDTSALRPEELGFFSPTMRPVESLTAGEVATSSPD